MSDKKQKKDWRSLPRKPASEKRSCPLAFRVSVDELARIDAAAEAAGKSRTDHIIDAAGKMPRRKATAQS